MTVTLNEIERTCQKALCGAGAPPGIDDEGGAAAAWLEARGIPALGAVLAAVEAWDGDPTASILERTSQATFDAAGRSAVFAGPGLIGLAASGAVPRLAIENLAHSQFLIPQARSLCKAGRSFVISWGAGGQEAGARIEAISGVALLGDWPVPIQGAASVRIETGRPVLPLAISAADLEARRRDALSTGIAVSEDLWSKLAPYARRILVPASALSRTRGAGSLTGDNE